MSIYYCDNIGAKTKKPNDDGGQESRLIEQNGHPLKHFNMHIMLWYIGSMNQPRIRT